MRNKNGGFNSVMNIRRNETNFTDMTRSFESVYERSPEPRFRMMKQLQVANLQ